MITTLLMQTTNNNYTLSGNLSFRIKIRKSCSEIREICTRRLSGDVAAERQFSGPAPAAAAQLAQQIAD